MFNFPTYDQFTNGAPKEVKNALKRDVFENFINNIQDEFDPQKAKLKQGFGIALLIIGAVGAILAGVFAMQLPLIALISIGILSAAALGTGIFLTVRGFESPQAKQERLFKSFLSDLGIPV